MSWHVRDALLGEVSMSSYSVVLRNDRGGAMSHISFTCLWENVCFMFSIACQGVSEILGCTTITHRPLRVLGRDRNLVDKLLV